MFHYRNLGSLGAYIWQVLSLASAVAWSWVGDRADGGDDSGVAWAHRATDPSDPFALVRVGQVWRATSYMCVSPRWWVALTRSSGNRADAPTKRQGCSSGIKYVASF